MKSKCCKSCENEFIPHYSAQVFCSRSCSAIVNNSKSPKRKRTVVRLANCLHCQKELGSKATKYCSVKCQALDRSATKLAHWLETGEGNINSDVTSYIRNYLYVEQNYLCAICSMPNLWQGVELRFVLDHIDGNAKNNRRDNLRLVCPNCDSQLPTYKSKNKGNGRHSRRERYAAGQSY